MIQYFSTNFLNVNYAMIENYVKQEFCNKLNNFYKSQTHNLNAVICCRFIYN